MSATADDDHGDDDRHRHPAEHGQCATHHRPGGSQMGSLRKMGRGTCRNTIITYLNGPGAHTSSLPLADAVTASSATASLSTVNGASLARGFPVRDSRRGAYLTRTDHQYSNSVLPQGFPEAEVEAVQPGLGGPVHEVRPPHPLACGRAHCDDST